MAKLTREALESKRDLLQNDLELGLEFEGAGVHRCTLPCELHLVVIKEALYIGEPTRQQKNLVIAGCRVEFN